MKELQTFYKTWLRILVVLIVSTAVAYHVTFVPLFAEGTARSVAEAGEKLLVLVMFFTGEAFIRTRFWKLIHPELDLSGDWTGKTVYQLAQVPKEGLPHQPFEKEHSVKIEQDCFSVAIVPTARGFHKWSSIVMTFEPPHLRYAYDVQYEEKDLDRFPDEAYGYEEMEILRAEGESPKARPRTLGGRFFHCAMGKTPVYSGPVTFTRTKTKQEQVVESLNAVTSREVKA